MNTNKHLEMKINEKKETIPFTFWPAECDIIKYDDFNNFFWTIFISCN